MADNDKEIAALINKLSEYANDEHSTQEAIDGILTQIRTTTNAGIQEEMARLDKDDEAPKPALFPSEEIVKSAGTAISEENEKAVKELTKALADRNIEAQARQILGEFIFTRIREVKAPGKAHPTDAGIDFYVPEAKAWDFEFRRMVIDYSRNPTDELMEIRDDSPDGKPYIVVKPGGHIAIPSGIKTIIPAGYGMMFVNKSGVATKLKLAHSACLVDAAYRDEVIMCFFNNGSEEAIINPGQKIAQGLIVPIINLNIQEVLNCVYDDMGKATDRGGGFGSSGTK